MSNKSTDDTVTDGVVLPNLPIPAAESQPGQEVVVKAGESKILPALPEAAGICWVDVWETFTDEETGAVRYCRWNVTHRSAESGVKAFGELHASLHKFLETHPSLSLYPKHEVPAIQRGADAQAQASGAFGTGRPATGATPFGGKQQQAAATPSGNGGTAIVPSGTGTLTQIVVHPVKDGKTKIEFSLATLKYPVPDSRGPTVVAALFDPELGITPEMLSKPAVFTPESWGAAGFPNLVVDWEKPDKWYNIKKVRSGSA